jgi:peptidoglycan/LPS O-acetylase OafA/YrhL
VTPTPFGNLIGSGYVAVSLFFVLSGFIISYTYLTQGGGLRGTPRNFYVSRFARIYPAYLLAFLLAAPTDIQASLHANHLGTAVGKLAVNALMVLTMQQAWTPWTAWAWNFPAWSVSVEVFFYLLFPWIGPRLARVRSSSRLPLAAAFWATSLCAPFALWLLKGRTGPPQLGDHLQMAVEFTPLLRLPEFAIGILLGRAFVHRSPAFDKLQNLSLPITALILGVLMFCPFIPHPLLASALMTPLFAALIVSLAMGKGLLARFLSLPLLILLGEASYGIYILQIPVSFLTRTPPPLTSPRLLAVYCLCLVAFAVLSFSLIETPMRRRIRLWLGDGVAV